MSLIMKQQASAIRRRRKRRWLQLLASASSNLTTTIYTTAHNYQHEQQQVEERKRRVTPPRASIKMVATSTLYMSIIVCISLFAIMSNGFGGCHAAPGTLDLVSKFATHRGSSSSSPGASSSLSSSASHLVKSARLATYSLSCPPEASIHPCTCIYHTPGTQIESEEEEEEIYELSPAITTPYAEPLVQTTTPASQTSTTAAVPPSSTTTTTTTTTATTTTKTRPAVTSQSAGEIDATDDRRTKSDPPPNSSSSPATTMTTTTTATAASTTVAPTQSASTAQPNERDAQIGKHAHPQQAVPSFVVIATTSTTAHEPQVTNTTTRPEQQASSTTSAPALKMTTPVDGTSSPLTTKVTEPEHSGSARDPKGGNAESTTTTTTTTARPQQNGTPTTSAPLTSGHVVPVTPVAIQTNSSVSSASVESHGGQESRNGAIASSSPPSVNLNNSPSLGQGTAGAVGQQQQQQEAIASEKRPAKNPAAADQKIPAQQSLDSFAPPPYQPPLVQPPSSPPPGSIAELPARVTGEQTQQSPSNNNNKTNVNQTGKQTHLELDTATSRVISPAVAAVATAISLPTAQAKLGQAQPLVAETTTASPRAIEIPLRLTPSSTATIGTEMPALSTSQPLKLTSGGGPFVLASETLRPTTTPMPLQTTSVAPSQRATASPSAEISGSSLNLNLTVPAATTEKPLSVGSSEPPVPLKVALVADQIAQATNESGKASLAATGTTQPPPSSTTINTAAAPTTPGLELSGARHNKQEVVTSPRPAPLVPPAPYPGNVATSIQTENNSNGTPVGSPISSSAAMALNETKHDYKVVSVAANEGVESTNLAKYPPKTTASVISNNSHEVQQAASVPIQSGSARTDTGARRPVTLDTLAATATSTATVAPAAPASSPASVTNQSPSSQSHALAASGTPTSAPAIVISSSQGSRQQSNASEINASAASASASVSAPAVVVQPALVVSSQVQSVKPQHHAQPTPKSSTAGANTNASSHQPGTDNSTDSADQTNAPSAPTHTIHRPANNGAHRSPGPPSGNSSAPKASGERPPSAGRAIHHRPLIVGGDGGNNHTHPTSQQHNHTTAHQNPPQAVKPAHSNHQSLAASAAAAAPQTGRQILTPNTHRPKPHASRPNVAASNHHHHHHINSSGHHNNNQPANSLGGRESPQASVAGSAASASSSFSPGPRLRRSTRSAGNGARPLHAQANHTAGNRSPHQLPKQQRLTPNTLAAQASRRPNVVLTSTPNANPQFTNSSSSSSSQRAPGGRRLTRFLSHDHHSGNLLSAADPFADASEQKVEVVAYCRNIQNSQVLRSAIKGFRGHQVNYFVIDSCKVPPFPNDLFHGIDVRWLEMSNSTVQFHNNFLHGAHHNQQGQLA